MALSITECGCDLTKKMLYMHHKVDFISHNELLTLGVTGLCTVLLREPLYFAKTAATAAAATAAVSGIMSGEGVASLFEVVAAAGSLAVTGAGMAPLGPEPVICNAALPEAVAATGDFASPGGLEPAICNGVLFEGISVLGDFAALTAALLPNIHRLGEFTPLTLTLVLGVTSSCPECEIVCASVSVLRDVVYLLQGCTVEASC